MARHLMDKLRKLLRVRSPSLAALGHYQCQNCQHHDPNRICVVCEENPDILLCNLKHAHVTRFYTCKHAKPIVVKPCSQTMVHTITIKKKNKNKKY